MQVCNTNMPRSLIFAILIILAVCSIRVWAWAHAIVVDSTPRDGAVLSAPPQLAVLRFNARIEKSLSSVKLFRSDGRSFPVRIETSGNGAGAGPDRLAVRLPHLGPGNYILQYKVLATDGHLTPGVLRFGILKGR